MWRVGNDHPRRTRGFSFRIRPYFLFLLLSTTKKRGGEDFVGFRWSEIEKRSIRARVANNSWIFYSRRIIRVYPLSYPRDIFIFYLFSGRFPKFHVFHVEETPFPLSSFWSLETVKGSSNRRDTGWSKAGRPTIFKLVGHDVRLGCVEMPRDVLNERKYVAAAVELREGGILPCCSLSLSSQKSNRPFRAINIFSRLNFDSSFQKHERKRKILHGRRGGEKKKCWED